MVRKLESSRKLQKRAEQMIPCGVNSPVRAFGSVGGDTLFIVRRQGPHLWDADENRYIDYVGSWGPLILGHAPPGVPEAIATAAKSGTSAINPTRTRTQTTLGLSRCCPVNRYPARCPDPSQTPRFPG